MKLKNSSVFLFFLSQLLFSAFFSPAFAEAKHAKEESGILLDKIVAIVNDDVITENEVKKSIGLLEQQIQAQGMTLPQGQALKKAALERLISENLLLQLAKRNNLTVDEVDLNEALTKIAANNHLSLSELQEAVISQEGLTWENYRESIRKEMLIAKLQQGAVSKDIHISKEQIENYLKTSVEEDRQKGRFHLQNLLIPLSEEPSPEELRQAQQKAEAILKKINQSKDKDLNRFALLESSFQYPIQSEDLGKRMLSELPGLFAREVVKMKVGEVIGPLRAGNGFQLIRLVGFEKGEVVPEAAFIKTHLRHILIKPGVNLTPKEAKKQAEHLFQQLKSGSSFEQMAKQYSSDLRSATNGGELWVSPGEWHPVLEKEIESMPLHQLSHPIQTALGWHLIEVLERKKVENLLDYQRQQARQVLFQRKFVEAAQQWQQHLRSLAYVKIMDENLA